MARSSLRKTPDAVLIDIVRQVEARGDGDIAASILRLVDGRLRLEAAAGLPAEYRDAIDGFEVGPNTGSCGTAAHRGHPIYVPDIGSDILWAGCPALRDSALAAGFNACWSMPIIGADRCVLGCFAIYHRDPRGPTAAERRVIAETAAAASKLLAQPAIAA